MEEQLIEFDIAKLAKKKGFNIPTFYYYRAEGAIGKNVITHRSNTQMNVWDDTQEKWSAPTQSLLQKWLREEHNIHLTVQYSKHWEGYQWRYDDWRFREENPDMRRSTYTNSKTYEEALEKGLQEALKLIK